MQDLPVTYQPADTRLAFDIMSTGDSQAFVSVGSSGKSNFVNFLTRPDVKRAYVRDRQPYNYIMVLLNPHHMVHLEESALEHSGHLWPGYELLLSRLRFAVHNLTREQMVPGEEQAVRQLASQIETYYGHMFHRVPLMAQSGIRRVEDAIYEIMRTGPNWRVVVILDELEEFFRSLPPEFFQSLRGLRDDFKQRVMYITTSRSTPYDMLQQEKERYKVLEGFTELFNDVTHYLRPLDDASADFSVRRYVTRYRRQITDEQKQYLLWASGKHAGLLRRGFHPACASTSTQLRPDAFSTYLVGHESIHKECQSIYDSLTEEEQAVLKQVAQGTPSNRAVYLLRLKHLLDDQGGIALPVLETFVRLNYT
jgi:hypothetical protein